MQNKDSKLPTVLLLLIAATFQVGWLAAVVGASYGYAWLGVLVAPFVVTVEIVIGRIRGNKALIATMLIALVGITVDSLLRISGVFVFPAITVPEGWPPFIAPPFLISLWAIFAFSLAPLYVWLKGRLPLQILFGAFGGSSSYYAGYKLEALELMPSPTTAVIIIAVIWAAIFPLALTLIHKNMER